jgi:hypothetical protein
VVTRDGEVVVTRDGGRRLAVAGRQLAGQQLASEAVRRARAGGWLVGAGRARRSLGSSTLTTS